jgi:hypothetical protein
MALQTSKLTAAFACRIADPSEIQFCRNLKIKQSLTTRVGKVQHACAAQRLSVPSACKAFQNCFEFRAGYQQTMEGSVHVPGTKPVILMKDGYFIIRQDGRTLTVTVWIGSLGSFGVSRTTVACFSKCRVAHQRF